MLIESLDIGHYIQNTPPRPRLICQLLAPSLSIAQYLDMRLLPLLHSLLSLLCLETVGSIESWHSSIQLPDGHSSLAAEIKAVLGCWLLSSNAKTELSDPWWLNTWSGLTEFIKHLYQIYSQFNVYIKYFSYAFIKDTARTVFYFEHFYEIMERQRAYFFTKIFHDTPIKCNHQLIGNFCFQWIKWWWSPDLNYLCLWLQLLARVTKKIFSTHRISIEFINVNSQEFPGEPRINHGQSWLQRLCQTWQRHHTHTLNKYLLQSRETNRI